MDVVSIAVGEKSKTPPCQVIYDMIKYGDRLNHPQSTQKWAFAPEKVLTNFRSSSISNTTYNTSYSVAAIHLGIYHQ